MRKTALPFLIFLSLISFEMTAQKSCPVNFNGGRLKSIILKIRKHEGETVAFDAEVLQVENGYNDIPYFCVSLENGGTLWIASMVSDNYVRKGAKLRLLGYIDIVKSDDNLAVQYNHSGFQVRIFAMLDHLSKQIQFSNAFEAETLEWKAGTIPENRRY